MSLELMLGETLDRVLTDVQPPPVDPDAVRRAARAPRRARIVVIGALVLLMLAVGTTMLRGGTSAPPSAVDPGTLPAMDFSPGLRGFYDPQSGDIHLGGQALSIGDVRDLDAGAAMTTYGLIYFSADQAVRLLNMAGRVQTLTSAPADPQPFTPSVRFDIYTPLAAWATRSGDQVTVSVYRLGQSAGVVGRYPVPCKGAECDAVEVAGLDMGLVFIRTAHGSQVLDPADGKQAAWTTVTDGRVVDVRNRVILTLGGDLAAPLPLDAGWRLTAAASLDSRLTFEGQRQLTNTTTLVPTRPEVAPLTMGLPESSAETRVHLDSDGSVLVARQEGGVDVFWDCDLTGSCFEIGRMPATEQPPVFIG